MKAIPSHRPHLLALSGPAATLSLLAIAGLVSAGCTGGSKGDPDNRGDFKVASISSGSGAVFPYRIRTTDSFGNPTSTVVNIESDADLRLYVSSNNGVLPVATLPTSEVLPDGTPGNHFLHFTFTHKLQIESILSGQLADQANSGLTGALTILGYDPSTETSLTLKGRGFVNGYSFYNEGGTLRLVQAVEADGSNVEIIDPRAAGFPSYAGAADLVSTKSFVFVADTDGDLQTFESFPSDRLLRITVTNAVRDSENDILEQEMAVATTVGPDNSPPEVLGYLSAAPQISPGNNATGVDPTGTIQITFNKPVQPGEVGTFFDANLFTPPSGGVSLNVTLAAATFPVIYYADPISYADLTRYIVRPAYSLPGQSEVDVIVQETTITSLTGELIGTQVATQFTTGVGPGLINAPVAPEAIYFGIGGAEPGVSVLDLNGFGQGTGDLATTRWPLNPNIGRPGVVPPLAPGTSSFDAGGAGTLTLTQDTNGSTRLLRDPFVGEISDIHIGAPLDLVFNNENINVNARRPNQVNELRGATGGTDPGNTITQPPHPNPPRLIFPPPNPNRAIFGEEPTMKTSVPAPGNNLVTGGPPAGCLPASVNFLATGNPFTNEPTAVGTYGTTLMGVFVGPQPPPGSPPPPTPFCPFTSRQQVGHFLYALDRDNRQIVVLNSNRFTVLDTIRLSDPVNIAMSPNMKRMAVSNFASSSVSIIDIDPLSSTFHQVITETRIDSNPSGIAWQPDGEDILVVSTDANALTILTAVDFSVRRTLGGFLNGPIDVLVTERYFGHGNTSGLYYAYLLNSNGTISVYESGPDGVNGFGFNDIIGNVTNVSFARAKSMMYDMTAGFGGIFIGHSDENGLGQVSRLSLTSTPLGPQPLTQVNGGFILPPFYRQKEWTITQKIGGTGALGNEMSGNSIVDICFDDMRNTGGYTGQGSLIGPAYTTTPYIHSGKHTLKVAPNGALAKAVAPRLLFVALSDVGVVDVYDLQTISRIRSIPVPGVRVVSNYWRQ